MNKKEYMETMKAILEMQIGYIEEDENYEDSDFLQGQVVGLRIAIEKLNASAFLAE